MTENKGTFSNIMKSATLIMMCTVIYKLLGFFREFILSYFWGTSGISDAFLISLTIPGTLFDIVGVGLTTCFIPIYFDLLKSGSKYQAYAFTNKVCTLIFVFATILILLVWIDTPLIVKLFASGFSDETLNYACQFTRIGVLSLYFSGFVFVLTSYLQTENRFFSASGTAVYQSALVLLSIYLGAKVNIWLMPIGCALSIGTRILVLYPHARKFGYRFNLDFRWKDESVKQLGKLLLPVVLGVAVNDLNILFDRTIASQVAVGAISALMYANSIIHLAIGGVVQPVATVFYPNITKSISEKNMNDAVAMIKRTMSVILIILVPLSLFFFIYSENIVSVLFNRGAFDNNSLCLTHQSLLYYSVGLIFIGVREVVSRIYYAYSDTKTPMINSAIGVAFNILLNFILSKYMGVGGLALATSISALITAVLLIHNSSKKLNICVHDLFDWRELSKVVFSTLITGAVTFFLRSIFNDINFINLALIILVAIITYILTAIVTRMENIMNALSWIKNKIK